MSDQGDPRVEATPRSIRESPRPRLSPRLNDAPASNPEASGKDIEAGSNEPLLPPQQSEEPNPPVSETPIPNQPPEDLVATQEPLVSKVYEPIRTNPIEGIDQRSLRRKLDRLVNEQIPEIHIVGRITHGMDLVHDINEGAFCRFKVSVGKAWQVKLNNLGLVHSIY